MTDNSTTRNSIGLLIALLIAGGWYFKDQVSSLMGCSGVSPARAGMVIMAKSASDAEARKNARKHFERSLKADDRDPLALFGLGWVAQLDGNREEAKEKYAKALTELQDVLQAARFNQSLALEESGDVSAAYEQIRLMLRIDPKNEGAKRRQEDLIRKLRGR